jgi:hypothetical protein
MRERREILKNNRCLRQWCVVCIIFACHNKTPAKRVFSLQLSQLQQRSSTPQCVCVCVCVCVCIFNSRSCSRVLPRPLPSCLMWRACLWRTAHLATRPLLLLLLYNCITGHAQQSRGDIARALRQPGDWHLGERRRCWGLPGLDEARVASLYRRLGLVVAWLPCVRPTAACTHRHTDTENCLKSLRNLIFRSNRFIKNKKYKFTSCQRLCILPP